MRSINAIAANICADWPKPHYAALPYLRAMLTLDRVEEQYHEDTGRSVVTYFLANASTYRTPLAASFKSELRDILKCQSWR